MSRAGLSRVGSAERDSASLITAATITVQPSALNGAIARATSSATYLLPNKFELNVKTVKCLGLTRNCAATGRAARVVEIRGARLGG